MNKKEGILDKLQTKVLPIANKIAQQKHIRAVSSGLMYVIPMSLLGAIFSILANPPITEAIMQEGGWYASLFGGWYHFAQTYHDLLVIPSNMTMGLIAVIAVIGISYNLAKSYKLSAISAAFTSLIMFLIVSAPAEAAYLASAIGENMDLTTLMTTNVLNASYLGSAGLFVAIIIGLTSVELTRFCKEKNLVIKMPDAVPPNVADSFSSVIPVIINCIVFFGFNILCENFMGVSLPAAINKLLTPAISNVNSPLAIIGIITLGNFLWLFGIHGASITSMLYIPVSMAFTAENAGLVASGQEAIFQPVMITEYANAFLGITILLLFAKSKQLKAIGKVGIVPGAFLISEPIIFGAPIMFNPILAIPHLVAPIVSMGIAYIAGTAGWIQPSFNLIFAQLPYSLNPFFSSMSFSNMILAFILLGVQILIWYPFFKIYDKQLLLKEQNAEASIEAND